MNMCTPIWVESVVYVARTADLVKGGGYFSTPLQNWTITFSTSAFLRYLVTLPACIGKYTSRPLLSAAVYTCMGVFYWLHFLTTWHCRMYLCRLWLLATPYKIFLDLSHTLYSEGKNRSTIMSVYVVLQERGRERERERERERKYIGDFALRYLIWQVWSIWVPSRVDSLS